MQVHAFGAKHALVNGVVFIALHPQLSLPVPVHYNAAANTAVTTGCFE
jgi:hypothetical protein